MNVWQQGGVPIKAWTEGVEFEAALYEQVRKLSTLPFLYKHIALMPDVHGGIGCSIGTVIATKGAILPAACGVDIGCGVRACKLNLVANALPDTLGPMRAAIEDAVPVGMGAHGSWTERSVASDARWQDLAGRLATVLGQDDGLAKAVNSGRASLQLGTLGSGNHFIEVCLDETEAVWVLLHSGSRGIGNRIGTYYINLARKEMERWYVPLPDRDLAYLPVGTEYFGAYWRALCWAQDYALINRVQMMEQVVTAVGEAVGPKVSIVETIDCHHNYIASETHFGQKVFITRKGAVRAAKGLLGIIPGAMGKQSYIVEGLGNPESFESCSHGAGRRMSRTAAKAAFTVEQHAIATAGVECRKDAGVLDETPGAYKDLTAVMRAQADLVRPVHTLRAVANIKG